MPTWRSRRALARVATVAVALVVVGLPELVMVARAELDGDYRTPLSARVTSATSYNADLAQFALPSPGSRFFGDDYGRAADALGSLSSFTIDSSVTLGWATVALALVGIATTRRARRTWWLAGAVAVSLVLSLGPNPKVLGHAYTPLAVDAGEKVSLVAPGTWLLAVPVVNELRIPARYAQLGALPLVLLAGLGAQALVRWRRVAGALLVAAVCAVAVTEGAVALRPAEPQGERLARIIRDDPRPGIVVDVPLSWRSGIEEVGSSELSPRAMLQQTIHGKPIASGYIARMDATLLDRLLARPLYRSLLLRQGDGVVPSGLVRPRTRRGGRGRPAARGRVGRRLAGGRPTDPPVPRRHRVPPRRRAGRRAALQPIGDRPHSGVLRRQWTHDQSTCTISSSISFLRRKSSTACRHASIAR